MKWKIENNKYLPSNASRHCIASSYALTNNAISHIAATQIEHILLMAIIRKIISFDFERELLHKRTGVSCFCVWICIPGLLLNGQRTLRQKPFDPTGQMAADMIDFPRILSIATRSILIRFVGQNLYATTCSTALVATLFLQMRNDADIRMVPAHSMLQWLTRNHIIILTAIIYNWAIRYSSTVNGNGILYSLINILATLNTSMSFWKMYASLFSSCPNYRYTPISISLKAVEHEESIFFACLLFVLSVMPPSIWFSLVHLWFNSSCAINPLTGLSGIRCQVICCVFCCSSTVMRDEVVAHASVARFWGSWLTRWLSHRTEHLSNYEKIEKESKQVRFCYYSEYFHSKCWSGN